MPTPVFDHEKLDVYRMSIDYVAYSYRLARILAGTHRHARDQWLRAAQSIPLNIAEGNGKQGPRDRARYFEIARGSALECAAIHDVLVAIEGASLETSREGKGQLVRIVAMLTRLVQLADRVAEPVAGYEQDREISDNAVEYEQEYEYEEGKATEHHA